MSVTKLYLCNRAAPYTPATIRGTWSDTAGAVTRALDGSKDQGGATTTVARAETSATNPFNVLLYRGVSGPLAAQTISGTVDTVIGLVESNASADFSWRLHLYVTQGDSDTPRGTLLSNYTDGAGVNEWPTGTGTNLGLSAAQTLSSLAISAGDRIVAELGYIARNSVTTSFTGTIRYGPSDANGDGMTDCTPGATATTTNAPFLLFSNAITEANAIRVSQVAVQSASNQPIAPGIRVSQVAVQSASNQPIAPGIRVSQLVVQSATRNAATPAIRVSQVVVQTATSTAVAVAPFNALLIAP